MSDISERSIQQVLIREFWSSSWVLMPNYTPASWWECDLFRLTRAGYFYEYEIKLTKSDFRADQKKQKSFWGGGPNRTTQSKYELLASDEGAGPKEFWIVVPEDLIRPNDLPDWAGLMYASQTKHGDIRIRRERTATTFKRGKVDDKVGKLAISRAYYRYLRQIGELAQMARQLDRYTRSEKEDFNGSCSKR